MEAGDSDKTKKSCIRLLYTEIKRLIITLPTNGICNVIISKIIPNLFFLITFHNC